MAGIEEQETGTYRRYLEDNDQRLSTVVLGKIAEYKSLRFQFHHFAFLS